MTADHSCLITHSVFTLAVNIAIIQTIKHDTVCLRLMAGCCGITPSSFYSAVDTEL